MIAVLHTIPHIFRLGNVRGTWGTLGTLGNVFPLAVYRKMSYLYIIMIFSICSRSSMFPNVPMFPAYLFYFSAYLFCYAHLFL